MRYWDSSVLLPLLVEEPDSERRVAELREDPAMVTWWATRVECASALSRLERAGKLSADELEGALTALQTLSAAWIEIQATPAVQDRALRLVRVHPLRAADALQLAAALIAVGDSPRAFPFACADARLVEAARKEGFLVKP